MIIQKRGIICHMPVDKEYILFLDESNVTKYNPYLLLGGIIISRKEYKEKLIPNIQQCKNILGNPHIIFHYTDILKKQNDFACMCSNTTMCESFWKQLYDGLNNTTFKILSSYIDTKKHFSEYPPQYSHDSYELLFSTIINNYIHFLHKNNARGSIVFESREETQNRKIQNYYFHVMKYGTNIYKKDAIEKYITTTSFIVKEENCIGLQVADIIANNCIKHINGQTVKHNMWNAISSKVYDGGYNDTNSYGLVKLF